MELNILRQTISFEEIKKFAEIELNCELKLIPIEFSIFEQYRIYPKEPRLIPKLWTYRIVEDKNIWYFGTLK